MRAIPEGCAASPRWYSLCCFSSFVDHEKATPRTVSVNPHGDSDAGSCGWVAKTVARLTRLLGVCAPPADLSYVDHQQIVEETCAQGRGNETEGESKVDVEVSRRAARAAEQAALREALEGVLDKLCEGERARRAVVQPPGSGALA